MRKLFVFLGVVLMTAGSVVSAQEVDSMAPLQKSSWGDAKTSENVDYIPEISLDMRGGYLQNFTEGAGRFFGDGLYLDINGYITPNLSYSVNHRIASSYYEDNSGFNGTNWLTLTYETDDFAFTFGKDGLLVGSFEYDAYDLDTYYDMNSMFYNMLDCWQWAVSGSWYPNESNSLIFQFANSPFSYGSPNMFSYAAGWRGEWDAYESYWTANLWEYDKGAFVKALNLGNRFHFGNFSLDLEYMTRCAELKSLFSKDFTAILAPSYNFAERCRVFAKFGMEHVAAELPYELAYEEALGMDSFFYGAGAEFYPIKDNSDLRLHAVWAANSSLGHTVNIGLTWKMNLSKAIKGILSL